ncbi:hypothetical protein HanXRQr2_Chr04g0178641 [Helianthus annuus]|uniref:Uncharacterized protein n=1 Tax=Helianthus annuus TaxID=4232 RepID=A0A9K3J9A4_HELAN|nr:hypothetical protein HanXRQr2_Chr04g0178641 [Helianthus annuus]KAJ0932324.1 hypothetical protein HanPSC8_Chr04g0172351 [Helianthus annuus]
MFTSDAEDKMKNCEMEKQTTILKMLLKNKEIPANREGESEDREREREAQRTDKD